MAIVYQKKFLVKLPLPWQAKPLLHKAYAETTYQTFLHTSSDKKSYSLLCKMAGRTTRFSQRTKEFIRPGVYDVLEFDLDQPEYRRQLFSFGDFHNRRIDKTRYFVHFARTTFRVDIFDFNLKGLATINTELTHSKQKILLPPQFKIIKEITEDPAYCSANLVKVRSYTKEM